ncbi:hypothetical protein HanHA300_Chr02g0051801 [Helianthus annuus]|nr:hypothetical protein HanHA300_Chr02g0051801 [Helianthus annuus]KAJ0618596.1 hypothetical protein HanHA89_Chr02g0055221 [Helianthus annuus]KAJ0777049.1 hypothetical protein HanLR1_Chr02g0052831 [Helianthus annuus]
MDRMASFFIAGSTCSRILRMFLTPKSLCAFLKISVCSGRKCGARAHSGVHRLRWYLQAAQAWLVPPLRVIIWVRRWRIIWVRNDGKKWCIWEEQVWW